LQSYELSYKLLKFGGLKLANAVSLAEKLDDPIRSFFLYQLAALFILQIWVLEVDFVWN
jgi:hypothetical protein